MRTRDRHNQRRKASLKKETIRALDLPALSPADLGQAAGGVVGGIARAIYTCKCPTMDP